MKVITNSIIGIVAAAALTLGTNNAAAQAKPAHPTPVRRSSMTRPSTPPSNAPKASGSESFRGVANKLGTTPDALESSYQTAKQANPKLSRGQFVAANILAQNLSSKNPAITTQAILSGLQSGKSIGQTLQSLGLSADQAKDAEKQARRDAVAAQRSGAAASDSTKH
jgi:hypothetical protein